MGSWDDSREGHTLPAQGRPEALGLQQSSQAPAWHCDYWAHKRMQCPHPRGARGPDVQHCPAEVVGLWCG